VGVAVGELDSGVPCAWHCGVHPVPLDRFALHGAHRTDGHLWRLRWSSDLARDDLSGSEQLNGRGPAHLAPLERPRARSNSLCMQRALPVWCVVQPLTVVHRVGTSSVEDPATLLHIVLPFAVVNRLGAVRVGTLPMPHLPATLQRCTGVAVVPVVAHGGGRTHG